MDNITTYSARRTNVFVWLSVLLSLVAAVTRIMFFSQISAGGFWGWLVYMIIPVLANLSVCVRLPYRGEEMFYVTIAPVIMFAFYFFVSAIRFGLPGWMAWVVALLILLLTVVYHLTFAGRIPSKLPVLLLFLAPLVLYFFDDTLPLVIEYYLENGCRWLLISDAAIYLGIITMILSARKLPAPAEGEPRRRRFGDRYDGYLVHDVDPMASLVPYFMPNRVGSMNLIKDTIECEAAERYIREMRKAGYKHFGINHLLIAAYVRCIADYPDVNRFIAGQKIYSAKDVIVSMAIKKDMKKEGIETTIKVQFDPADTAADVYEKFDAMVQSVKNAEPSGFDKLTQYIDYVPGLLKAGLIQGMRLLDYFKLLPDFMIKAFSPFHASTFITSMGSLGIPPIYHHLYDWGTVPTFIAFGNKYTKYELDAEGNVHHRKYMDYTCVTDERTVDGYYYSLVLRRLRSYILHPERLSRPPEEIATPRI